MMLYPSRNDTYLVQKVSLEWKANRDPTASYGVVYVRRCLTATFADFTALILGESNFPAARHAMQPHVPVNSAKSLISDSSSG